jgi:hypothetical protein
VITSGLSAAARSSASNPVAGGHDDVQTGVLEDPAEHLPHECRVVDDQHPDRRHGRILQG